VGRWCVTGSRWPETDTSTMSCTWVAICQARSDVRGGAYYQKKLAEGKSRKEALRCLKRRISDAVFRSLMADLEEPSCSAA
jgi:transposase